MRTASSRYYLDISPMRGASVTISHNPSIVLIVYLTPQIYMAQYLEMSDCEPAHSASHKAWLLIGFAVKLGHSVRDLL